MNIINNHGLITDTRNASFGYPNPSLMVAKKPLFSKESQYLKWLQVELLQKSMNFFMWFLVSILILLNCYVSTYIYAKWIWVYGIS